MTPTSTSSRILHIVDVVITTAGLVALAACMILFFGVSLPGFMN